MDLRVGILTISDSVSAGSTEDRGGPAIRTALAHDDWNVVHATVVPDEQDQIEAILRRWADDDALEVIFTTGGTGLGPRDVTPEATLAVATRLVPGIAEAIRAAGLLQTQGAMLSRAVACLRHATLIVNLPGSPAGATDGVQVVQPVLEHAIATIRGGRH
ncbi:MAG: MogA/MoaB family molybdenum cofactor biosynthesis protein [Chloroflexota bacterium]